MLPQTPPQNNAALTTSSTCSAFRDRCVRVGHFGCATGWINPNVFLVFRRARLRRRSCASLSLS
jgi:hypothetical protein